MYVTDLNAGWSPGNELGQFPFSDSLEALVNLRWVHLSLYDVHNVMHCLLRLSELNYIQWNPL